MAGTPSPARQARVLELLHSRGLVTAKADHQVLRYLEFRRQARALPLYDPRGRLLANRAWQITPAGAAAALRLKQPPRRRSQGSAEPLQIDLEEAIATSSGSAPECAPLPDPDAPACSSTGVSAHQGRSVETAGTCRPGARGAMPELHP